MSRITVESRAGWGPFAGSTRWYLCCDRCPMGNMFSFYAIGKLRNQYPVRGEAALHGWPTEDEARKALAKLEAHVNEVIALPKNEKVGSSKHWK